MHSDKQYVKGMLETGADGYLLKNGKCRQLTDAIYSTYQSKKCLSEDITEIVIEGYLHPTPKESDKFEQLSEKEKEIFVLLAEGGSIREIGE